MDCERFDTGDGTADGQVRPPHGARQRGTQGGRVPGVGITGVVVMDGPGELSSNDDDDDGVKTDVGDPSVPDVVVPSEIDDPTVLVDPPEVDSIRPSAMDETDGAPTTGRDANGMVAILDVKLFVLGLLEVLPEVVLPNVAGAQGAGMIEIGVGVTVDVGDGLVVEPGGCAVGVATGGAGDVWICAANAAEAHARPTQLNKPVFIAHSCSVGFPPCSE